MSASWEETHIFNPFYFVCFFVVFNCFAGNCPSMIQENKNFEPPRTRDLARPVPVVARPCLTLPTQNKQKSRKLARPVPVLARPCATPKPPFTNFFSSSSFILKHKSLSSIKHLSKTSITKNLQTFISPSNLHPIISKHHSKHNPPIKNNFQPPKPQIHQIHTPYNPNPKTTISLPISINKLKNLTLTSTPSLNQPFPQFFSPNPNLPQTHTKYN